MPIALITGKVVRAFGLIGVKVITTNKTNNMKTLKVLSIIGIVISAIGILGSFMLLVEGDSDGFIGIFLFGYYLALSVVALNVVKK